MWPDNKVLSHFSVLELIYLSSQEGINKWILDSSWPLWSLEQDLYKSIFCSPFTMECCFVTPDTFFGSRSQKLIMSRAAWCWIIFHWGQEVRVTMKHWSSASSSGVSVNLVLFHHNRVSFILQCLVNSFPVSSRNRNLEIWVKLSEVIWHWSKTTALVKILKIRTTGAKLSDFRNLTKSYCIGRLFQLIWLKFPGKQDY